MDENSLFKQDLVFWGNFSIDSGYEMMKEVFDKLHLVGAVFAGDDLIALGAIKKIEEIGYHMPDDISIVGFDDIYLSRFLKPPLTTVGQPVHKMGEIAAKLLLKRMNNYQDFTPEKIVIKGNLIIRRSVIRKN